MGQLATRASLATFLGRAKGRRVEPGQLGGYLLDLVERAVFPLPGIRRMMGPGGIVDLDYRELVADPAATLRTVCEGLGLAASEEDIRHMILPCRASTPV